jgi:hypothetical protein
MGYSGLISASLIDLTGATAPLTDSIMTPLPLGRFRMPSSSDEGTVFFENDRVSFEFTTQAHRREINVRFKHFAKTDEELVFFATLDEEPRDSMVIATPWAEDPRAFYYNRKIIGMRASGSLRFGGLVHGFEPEMSFALLDWGRGVWTRDNTWYWGFAQGWQDGRGANGPGTRRFGLNLGYGFGDTSAASENMAFLDGVATKLGDVRFEVPSQSGCKVGAPIGDRFDLLQPWHIVDDENKVDLVFTPKFDRSDYINAGVVISDQHQLFGTYNGTVTLTVGRGSRTFQVFQLPGAAEIVHNKY